MSEEWHQLLEKLSKDNVSLNHEILEHVKIIRRRLFITELVAWIRLIVVLVPIVLLLLWLPPRLREIWQDYERNRPAVESILRTVNDPALLLREILSLF